jgi:photoactive yellow protein
MEFEDVSLVDFLKKARPEELDQLPYGVVEFDDRNIIRNYNKTESGFSGLEKDSVLNRHVFTEVIPCMNNYLVALKFEEKDEIDEVLPYILSFKVKPTMVDIRLIKCHGLGRNFIIIKRR